tara:strand:- start:27 stop:443 length:417 start_codon:yes stop_codon:yes gene_type:complete
MENPINEEDLNDFKNKVKQWLSIDDEIEKHNLKIKELKKLKNKILQPQITSFMINYNISDLNTQQGKIKCNERITKKPLNKINIKQNLTKVFNDDSQIDKAMEFIMNNRETTTKYVLSKTKPKQNKGKELPIDTTSSN